VASQGSASGIDVCLALPPFGAVHFPHLGSAVLKSAVQARGLSARIVYGNIELAARAGLERYDAVGEAPMRTMLGERLFRHLAYPPETFARLPETSPLPPRLRQIHDAIVGHIAPTIDAMVEQILVLNPRIVGVSSTFEQNLACAAVARRVKEAAPHIVTVMGGANAAWPLCRGLAQAFPWIDHFFAGESDIDFPLFCERLVRHGERPAERIVCSEPIRDMRTVFPPDFGDFFAALRPHQASGALPEWLPRFVTMETSRGCWWGAKNHCTFCGLNGEGMEFRDKPAATALEELAALGDEWQVDHIHLTDNIMPHRYLTDLMPALAEMRPQPKLYYEVKANLSEAQVDTLARGGVVAIQPGIESLSSDVLRIMRKGVSAHQNIALLRSCMGVGIQVQWSIIYGFPGETAAHYEEAIAAMPKLAHLEAPGGAHRILIDRYSPYYKDPAGLGINAVSPFETYRALYPPEVATEDVAYHFDGHYSTGLLDSPRLIERFDAAVADWRRSYHAERRPMLQMALSREGALVLDTRPIARTLMTRLSPGQYEALVELERPKARAAIDPALAADADWLVERDFVIEHEGKLMSVVVRPRPEVVARVAPSSQLEDAA
jgi:ribosomal peptide maturation radical SAM protein 1